MFVITHRKLFFIIGAILIVGSIATMAIKGFELGVDFTGGSVLEVSYDQRPDINVLTDTVLASHPDARVQALGENRVIVRTEVIDQETKDQIVGALSTPEHQAQEERFNTIGPSIGSELRTKSILSMILVSLAIIFFIAYAFRGVAKPVSSWMYGLIAIVVLIHDIVIPAGVFALLGLPVDTLFIVGLLTILGVSINDTIVVFDRIRENLKRNEDARIEESYASVVGKSISQTMTRSINTSLTVLVALAVLWIFGPESTQNLALTMFLGMFFGTYSSIFLASPLLVTYERWNAKRSGEKTK